MKKLLNPFVTALIGLFVGGLLVIVYFKSKKQTSVSHENLEIGEQEFGFVAPTHADSARKMIKNLYIFMNQNPGKVNTLFNRSYVIEYKDFIKSIPTNLNSNDTLRIRIYPAMREYKSKPILSFILMVQKNSSMLWDRTLLTHQDAIQDQLGPCPINCPGGGDGSLANELFTESEWKKLMGINYYVPYP